MPASSGGRYATWRVLVLSFTHASIITASMTTVAAVAEQVHGDKGDKDHHPKPICSKPFHTISSPAFDQVFSSMFGDKVR